jgi:hypothetical protein
MEFREKPHKDKYKGIMNNSNYVASCTPKSFLVWNLKYFDRLIFVAQSVHILVMTAVLYQRDRQLM